MRKAAAERAHREWMPVSDADWASYDIGDLATLFRLETRLTARAKQFDLGALLAGKSAPGEAEAALAAFRDGAWRDPARMMIGSDQQAWLAAGMKASRWEGKVWQVLVQQVVMASLRAPVAIAERAGGDIPDYVRSRLKAAAMASRAGLPMNMDAWDGYPAARERVFGAAQAADANLIVLAGDSHNVWASDLTGGDQPVGVEFAGQSVTSPGFESFLPQIKPETMAEALRAENPALKFTDNRAAGLHGHRADTRRGDVRVSLSSAMSGRRRPDLLALIPWRRCRDGTCLQRLDTPGAISSRALYGLNACLTSAIWVMISRRARGGAHLSRGACNSEMGRKRRRPV